jgi:nucleotide-binding universal stress UspA family protein
MTLKTILVPTDFSGPSTAALNCAKQLAGAFNASVHLLHVIKDPTGQPWVQEASGTSPLDVLADILIQTQKDLELAMPESEQKRYHAELVTAVGSPFGEIMDYAMKNNVDLIVMGSHGRGSRAHALLGSVMSERVVRFAPCPVLTVRAEVTAGQGMTVEDSATAAAGRSK